MFSNTQPGHSLKYNTSQPASYHQGCLLSMAMNQNRNTSEYDSHGSVERRLKDLRDYFSRVLAVNAEHDDRSILFCIKRRLHQHRLRDFITPEDILHEAFIRTEKALLGGEPIKNIPGWINRVSLNIIREKKRQRQSHLRLKWKVNADFRSLSTSSEADTFIELHAKHIDSLWVAWQQLKESDQEILTLKHVHKLSWKEIAAHLTALENKKVSHQTTRKRGERALFKLRVVFFSSIEND